MSCCTLRVIDFSMPLRPGDDPNTVSANIRELERSGRPHRQAIAIALRNARETALRTPRPKTAHELARQIAGRRR